MKSLKFKLPKYAKEDHIWHDEVMKLVDICKKRGYRISALDAQYVWEEYSDSLATCWANTDNEDKVFSVIMSYCVEKEYD